MRIEKTTIPGLLLINLQVFEDSRGYFQEKFQRAKLIESGFPESFLPVQQNVSYNKKVGTVRGLHAEPWDKHISVIKGRIFCALVDLRKENFGKVESLELDSNKALFIPSGVANSYQTLEPDVYYSYLVNEHWQAGRAYKAVNVKDAGLKIKWPINLDKAVISDKDLNNPMLSEITPF